MLVICPESHIASANQEPFERTSQLIHSDNCSLLSDVILSPFISKRSLGGVINPSNISRISMARLTSSSKSACVRDLLNNTSFSSLKNLFAVVGEPGALGVNAVRHVDQRAQPNAPRLEAVPRLLTGVAPLPLVSELDILG